MTDVDFVVVGQGLAGTALAWHLIWKGFRVHVIDRDAPATASRVAAGLVTPVTGKRLAKSWRWDELFPAAVAFYARVGAETGVPVYHPRPAVRLFRDDAERRAYEARADTLFRGLVRPPQPPVDEAAFTNPHGGFEMPAAGQLVVSDYLDVSRRHFAATGGYTTGDLDPARDVELTPAGVRVPRLGIRARGLIFCQGIDAIGNTHFPAVEFDPAKGEILTLRVPGLAENRVIHRGVWLLPLGGELYRAGATYSRDRLDGEPTAGGRNEIGDRLRAFLRRPFEVVGHQAAVRPIVRGRKLVMGRHPTRPQLSVFNGLGSKGALQAPFFAAQFADFLAGEGGIDPEVAYRPGG